MPRCRPVLLLLALLMLAGCAHASPMQSRHYERFIVCTGDGAQVVLGPGLTPAVYAQEGQLVGTSECVPTRMAIFNFVCTHDPTFQFFFAGIPGPPKLHGKSARLTTATGLDVLLDCHDQPDAPPPAQPTPKPGAGPAPQLPRSSSGPAIRGVCASGQPACGNWCCGSNERCCNLGPGPACVSAQPTSVGDGGFAVPRDACSGAVE